ncbi:MAG: hypothetical protein ABIH11_00215 [Candidatus Altiarchaeota archaeon]
MSGVRDRIVSVDFLRTLVIFNALMLHYFPKSRSHLACLDFVMWPVRTIQYHFFGVGTTFIFISGFMAFTIYFTRFMSDRKTVSKRLFMKGITIFTLFIVVVNLLRIVTGSPFPDGFMDFMVKRTFFLNVLLTFSFLFLAAPVFLSIAEIMARNRIPLFSMILVSLLFYHIMDYAKLPEAVRILFVDYNGFRFAFAISLVIYSVGFWFASVFTRFRDSMLAVTIGLVILSSYTLDYGSYVEMGYAARTIRELVLLACMMTVLHFMLDSIKTLDLRGFMGDKILALGKSSLLTYVFGNSAISLLRYRETYSCATQFISLLTIFAITYIAAAHYNKGRDITS